MELYADGQMVGQVQTEAEWEDMRGSREQFFDLRLCRPPDWIPKRLDTGFAAGFVKSDGSRGVYGLRLHRVPSSRSAALSTILRSVFGSDGQAFGFAALDDARPISGLTFMNEPDSKVYGYDHGDRRIRLGTFDDDATGTVVIAFVFGPRSDFDAPEFGLVFDSFTTNLPS